MIIMISSSIRVPSLNNVTSFPFGRHFYLISIYITSSFLPLLTMMGINAELRLMMMEIIMLDHPFFSWWWFKIHLLRGPHHHADKSFHLRLNLFLSASTHLTWFPFGLTQSGLFSLSIVPHPLPSEFGSSCLRLNPHNSFKNCTKRSVPRVIYHL